MLHLVVGCSEQDEIMLLEQLWREIPTLEAAIRQQALVADREQAWTLLRQLMMANAPSGGAVLPGAIIDQISDIAAVFGLADRLEPDLAGPGNPGVWLGVAKEVADLVIVSPLDRLTYRIEHLVDDRTATISPMCVGDISEEIGQAPAKALRYDAQRGRLGIGATGQVVPRDGKLYFRAERGVVSWADKITLDLVPRRKGDWVRGSGLDNVVAVLGTLAVGAALRQVEEALLEHNRRCVIVFPDRRDFDLGALHNWHSGGSLQPLLGTVLVESYVVDQEQGPHYEGGIAYSFGSATRRGVMVPVNYQQLACDLDVAFSQIMPMIAQFAGAALENSRCSGVSYNQRILGVMGPPLSRPHVGQEIVHLADVAAEVWWMVAYVALVLNLVPSATAQYALGR